MNDTQLEDLLRMMPPATPDAGLSQRVERDLALAAMFRDAVPAPTVQAKRAPWYVPATWALLGAAAAVLVMSALPPAAVLSTNGIAQTKVNPPVMPVNLSHEFVGVDEGNITFAKPDSPQREVNVRAVERRQWIDPRDGAEYIIEVPVNQSVTMPVKFQ